MQIGNYFFLGDFGAMKIVIKQKEDYILEKNVTFFSILYYTVYSFYST